MSVRLESLLSTLDARGMRLGLEATAELLAALGSPERGLPVVLVAGTNGKGSTAALLAAMAQAAGYRTGLYTSPHLESAVERLRSNGAAIDAETLADLLDEVTAAAAAAVVAPPTYFEALTVAALLWFARSGVELAVLEVGMGGRLDATNLADPVLSLVTSISLDHCEYLGNTLAAIAREKAGVLRAGRPALAWVEDPEAAAALVGRAAELGAALTLADRDTSVCERQPRGLAGQRVTIATPAGRHQLDLALLGGHQVRNAALAVRAAELLARQGFPLLDATAIAAGVARCRWPGRLEPVVLADGRAVLLDGAHNPGGVGVLLDFLDELEQPWDLLFGVLADKDVEAMLPPLASRARWVTLTSPPAPRALAPSALAELIGRRGTARSLTVEVDPGAALDGALAAAPGLLVACGSLYLVGAVRAELRARHGVPPPAGETLTG